MKKQAGRKATVGPSCQTPTHSTIQISWPLEGVFDSAQVGELLFINIFSAITEALVFTGTRCPLLCTEPMVPIIDSAERC